MDESTAERVSFEVDATDLDALFYACDHDSAGKVKTSALMAHVLGEISKQEQEVLRHATTLV